MHDDVISQTKPGAHEEHLFAALGSVPPCHKSSAILQQYSILHARVLLMFSGGPREKEDPYPLVLDSILELCQEGLLSLNPLLV